MLPHFMRRMTQFRLVLLATIGLATMSIRGATNDAPDFAEIQSLLRGHLSGATETELNRLAVEGLLQVLHGKVTLVGNGVTRAPSNFVALARSSLLESNVAYVRLAGFDKGLAAEVLQTVGHLTTSNKLIGLVLDLRFAEGDDYAAAAAVADLFQAKARPLVDWGSGSAAATAKDSNIKLPLGVLVNRETAGAAEALAAVLRETGVALLLGSTTEGSALITEEFPLKNGQRLRIATTPVKVADGLALTTKGVKPDIEVAASLELERNWLDDPYGTNRTGSLNTTVTSTNQVAGTNRLARRPRPNEADLVRARRDGVPLDGELPEGRTSEPMRPLIRDASLARAVDLLKGLAVVRWARTEK